MVFGFLVDEHVGASLRHWIFKCDKVAVEIVDINPLCAFLIQDVRDVVLSVQAYGTTKGIYHGRLVCFVGMLLIDDQCRMRPQIEKGGPPLGVNHQRFWEVIDPFLFNPLSYVVFIADRV